MFKIVNKTFHVSRGNSGIVNLTLKSGNFNTDDIVTLRIYEVQGLDAEPIKTISSVVEFDGQTATLIMDSEDTDFGDLGNEVTDYWYEIKVNEDKTILGFDDSGAKIFKLYPTGVAAKVE